MNVDFLKDVALAVAQEQHLERVLKMIVEGINEEPNVGLVRLWLFEPGDICTECYLRSECPDQTRCLHWWLARDVRCRRVTTGPGSMASSDEFRSASAKSGSLANLVNHF